jgi:glycosyltransferase involved in cell wall biosynthesis
MLTITFYFFIAVVTIQLVYYLGIFGKFAFAKPQKSTPKRIPISVIVCAKNEAENVTKFVPMLAGQDYPDYEIILIDDASSDNTLEILERFEKEYKNIRLVKVENNEAFWGNKKFALTLGIKAAKNEYLLFTDADCYPSSKTWIREMSSQFTLHKTIVLGYGAYEKIANSFLNKIIRYETMLTAVQYFSWAKAGRPYMGVGRNLAYKREEFFNVNGFIDHMKIRSGDDDLFINQAAKGTNTTICYSQDSFTYSAPKRALRNGLRKSAGMFRRPGITRLRIKYSSVFFTLRNCFLYCCLSYCSHSNISGSSSRPSSGSVTFSPGSRSASRPASSKKRTSCIGFRSLNWF